MIVTMLWHGGSSYATGTVEDHGEEFSSLRDAVLEFESRASGDPFYPCVDRIPAEDGGPSAWVFFCPKDEAGDYPDRVIEFGPRGGLKVMRA